jgi:hypothetical protein
MVNNSESMVPEVGDIVRSYDFEDREGRPRTKCYVLGRVEEIVQWGDCKRYKIVPFAKVFDGKDITFEKGCAMEPVYSPLNGTKTWFGGACNGVEVVAKGMKPEVEAEPEPEPKEEPKDFEGAFRSWMEKAQAVVDDGYSRYNGVVPAPKLEARNGRRYIRIVSNSSAFCFIDKTNGNVLKPAGWKGPTHNFPRGNIFTDKLGVTEYGAITCPR